MLKYTWIGSGKPRIELKIGIKTKKPINELWNTNDNWQSPRVNFGDEFLSLRVKWAHVTTDNVETNADNPAEIIKPTLSQF